MCFTRFHNVQMSIGYYGFCLYYSINPPYHFAIVVLFGKVDASFGRIDTRYGRVVALFFVLLSQCVMVDAYFVAIYFHCFSGVVLLARIDKLYDRIDKLYGKGDEVIGKVDRAFEDNSRANFQSSPF